MFLPPIRFEIDAFRFRPLDRSFPSQRRLGSVSVVIVLKADSFSSRSVAVQNRSHYCHLPKLALVNDIDEDSLTAKALHPNQIWNFQTNSIRFPLAVVIGKRQLLPAGVRWQSMLWPRRDVISHKNLTEPLNRLPRQLTFPS